MLASTSAAATRRLPWPGKVGGMRRCMLIPLATPRLMVSQGSLTVAASYKTHDRTNALLDACVRGWSESAGGAVDRSGPYFEQRQPAERLRGIWTFAWAECPGAPHQSLDASLASIELRVMEVQANPWHSLFWPGCGDNRAWRVEDDGGIDFSALRSGRAFSLSNHD